MPRDQKESEMKDIGITWKAYYGSESAGERTNESKVQFQSVENLCRYHPITNYIRDMRLRSFYQIEEYKGDHAL